jgi:hypothetical protein
MKMTSNGKILNHEVVDLVESYNFHIKFTSVRVQTKKLQIFEKETGPLPLWPTAVGRRYSTARLLPPWGTVVGPCRHPHDARCIVLQKIFADHIFLQKRGKKKFFFTNRTR